MVRTLAFKTCISCKIYLQTHISRPVDSVGWLVVFYVPPTARSFRYGAPITVPCKGREARFLHRSHRESYPMSSHGSPLHNRCAMPAPLGLV